MKEQRFDVSEFKDVLNQLKKNKNNFKLIETKHTKRIRLEKQILFFSEDVKCYKELTLINKVKKDAKNYIEKKEENKKTDLNKINFYYYNKTSWNGKEYREVYKLDLTSAYWQLSINEGIISKETFDFWEENKESFLNGHKKARLKALGSLATEKIEITYVNGKEEQISKICNEMQRNLYIYVCERVDEVMRIITYKFRNFIIYYYWDCFFICHKAPIKKIIKEVKKLGFLSKFEKEKILIQQNNNKHNFIVGYSNNHHYPINNIDLK